MPLKVITQPTGQVFTNSLGRLLAIDQSLRATALPALAPRVSVLTNSTHWAAGGRWEGLVPGQQGIVMPFSQAVANYGVAADQPTYTLTFQVTGTQGEGVQVLGCCEDRAPVRIWLDGKVLLPQLFGRSRYTELRTVLCAVWGLPAGTHTLGVQRLPTSSATGDGLGVLLGGAYVYTRVSTYK